ncbi:MAG: hypothetical protein ACLFNZ_08030 [Spirochaetaceae bacterium]
MKAKFLLTLFLLLAVGGAVFYFGWVQLRLPEHTYGVIFTKTGGWDTKTLKPGTFTWRWEGLIPTNMTLYRIPVEMQNARISREGDLPSGSVYSGTLDTEGDFTYKVDFSFSYKLKPDHLPNLVMNEGLNPDELSEWYGSLNEQLISAAEEVVSREFEKTEEADNSDSLFSGLEELLLEKLSEDFPFIELKSVHPRSIDIPDMDLYHAAKDHYLNILETKEKTERETLEQKRSWKVSEESKLDVLEKYGKLFTEYPGLIRYFALKETGEFENLLPEVDLIPNMEEMQEEDNATESE